MLEIAMKRELEKIVVEKAHSDQAYKKGLIQDPVGTLKKEFGLKVSDSVSFQVLEEREDKVYLVLPSDQKNITIPELVRESIYEDDYVLAGPLP